MRVVKIPVQYHSTAPPSPTKRKHRAGVYLVGLGGIFIMVQLIRPLPSAQVALSIPPMIPAKNTTLSLPSYGQSALTVKDYGLVATSGAQTQISTASIAKVITALCILEQKPLHTGQKGPEITMSRRDVELYQQEVSHNGSRVQVYEGQKMSEYMALQAIMIPSANNIANSLAEWAFGSLEAYSEYANNFAMRHGLVNTRIGSDASGYDPSTVSSASDLARLGVIAEKNALLMEIAGQESAVFPLSGEMNNYNSILGQGGITGLKTGNNEQNLGGFLFTGRTQAAGKSIEFAGSILGASSLSEALESSQALVASLPGNFEKVVVAQSSQEVGTVTTQWGGTAAVLLAESTSVVRYRGDVIKLQPTIVPTSGTKAEKIGVVGILTNNSTMSKNLIIKEPARGPSLFWRLTRIR